MIPFNIEESLLRSAEIDNVERIVVAGVCVRGRKVLLLRRRKDDFMGGLVELPSGKKDVGETIYECLYREVQEEAGLKHLILRCYLGFFDYISGSGKHTRQYNFLVESISDEEVNLSAEHEDFSWEEIDGFGLVRTSKEVANVIHLAWARLSFPFSSGGLLVSLEGQDAAGKSSLLVSVSKLLEAHGRSVKMISEFSDSCVGQELLQSVSTNRFLKLNSSTSKSAITEYAWVFADLAHKTEQEMIPALLDGKIVIVERYIDSLIACQAPRLTADYGLSTGFWVEKLRPLRDLALIPTRSFMLNVAEGVLSARLSQRSEVLDDEAKRVFKGRADVFAKLVLESPVRLIEFDNNRALEDATAEITRLILEMEAPPGTR